MPELPEVETLKIRLHEVLLNKTIKQVSVLSQRSLQAEIKTLLGQTIIAVNRRAKILYFTLSQGDYLLTHLKMTGQLIFVSKNFRLGGGHPTADWVKQLPSSHTRIIYTFSDDSKLFFNDQRLFGWMKGVDRVGLKQEFAKYGPDINVLTRADEVAIIKKMQKSSRAIKTVLLDGSLLAGLGNIYVAESLFRAKLHPLTPANTLSSQQLERLLNLAKIVIAEAIASGGTTYDGKYVHSDGFAGKFQDKLRVYGREKESCQLCGTQIEKIKIAGRGTWFCPNCQSL